MSPRTLLELAGVTALPARLSDTVLVVIDAQQEYVDGLLPLPGIDGALDQIGILLERARKLGTPVIHVVHHGRTSGGPFAPGSRGVEIASPAAPAPGEPVVTKSLPNAFASTDLADRLHALHRSSLTIAGFMTHMCVEATARAAIDLGLKAAVVASATTTRDLRDPLSGAVIPAAEVHRNALAALSDRFATIVASCDRLDD
ncbi:cysteine hydrolase family protein [Rhodoplanes sp. TEM]|uniref:Cysteine hydrolase family protein n=1 Tax=Rhodoplanes tepidamans TaxID=200616 RepID=A0ABT5J6Y0_RHOTP|nr:MULTISPECIES: cysteine hydrolase family protein [Rhodoplanes]MDC7785409.1 cysteine hydrolase family protein [Rhodoplanes tepidamans]MDC7986962.1 cysteine hydrolase family protein [Rhodoplanes sp. TEM]MDQ0353138.1 nicotinamidase-related amidase [Rhodoplanes tepidamans]